MADVAATVMGVLPLFNAVVEDICHIQVARNFGITYSTDALRLANVEQRLARWGKSVGLTGDAVAVENQKGDVGQAQDNLEQLRQLLGSARRKSAQYERGERGFLQKDQHQAKSLDDQQTSDLCKKIRKLTLSRAKEPTVWKKAQWALFDKTTFEETITNIVHLVHDLEDLFPGAQPTQERLAKEEVEELGADLTKQIVKHLATNEIARDKKLQDALDALAGTQTAGKKIGTMRVTISGTNHGGVQGGYNDIQDFHAKVE